MHELQQRLQDPSALTVAAEGLSEEARVLARDIELSAIIKNAKEEQDKGREWLKERYRETGERFRLGDAIEYSPTEKTTYAYNTKRFRETFGDGADPYLTVDGSKVAKALEVGLLDLDAVEDTRTASTTLVHGTKKIQEEK